MHHYSELRTLPRRQLRQSKLPISHAERRAPSAEQDNKREVLLFCKLDAAK